MHRSRESARFTGKGRIERDGEEPSFRHLLGIESRGLLLAGAERAGNCDGREFPFRVLRDIHISGKGNAEMIHKGHLAVICLAALFKRLISLLGEFSSPVFIMALSSFFLSCCFSDFISLPDLAGMPLFCSEQSWENDIRPWAKEQFADLSN